MKEKIINAILPTAAIILLVLFVIAVLWDLEDTVYELVNTPWALIGLPLIGALYIYLYILFIKNNNQY